MFKDVQEKKSKQPFQLHYLKVCLIYTIHSSECNLRRIYNEVIKIKMSWILLLYNLSIYVFSQGI